MATSPSRTGARGSASNRHRRGRLTAACLGAAAAQVILAGTALANPPASWGLDRIDQRGLPYDGEYCPTGDGAGVVNVYVVGTGIFTGHDDFGGSAVPFYDFDPPNMGEDQDGRGTWLASIAGGTTYGVAKDVWLNSVRVTDTGSWSPSALELGLRYVGANGTPGVVLIDGSASGDPLVDTAVADLVNLGYVVVVGAGDADSDACAVSPARESSAMTVAASDVTDRAWAQSNYGSCVDLFAPGVGITGAGLGSSSAPYTGDGTAAAAAHVAGAAAIILGENPGMSQTTVRNMMLANSTPNHLSDVGIGSPNRLLYVEPGPCPVPCPTCGGSNTTVNQALTAGIVGPVNGTDWSWQITATNAGDFDDTSIVLVPGVTTDYNMDGTIDELDVADKWADSINDYFSAQGCDSTAVTGQIWATARLFGSTAYLSISSKCPFTILVSDTIDPSTPVCALGDIFNPCSFNPDAESFPGSGTDCNLNGFDDFFDITFGLSADVNENAIPDECEGLYPEETTLGVTMEATGNGIITSTGDAIVVHRGFGVEDSFGYVTSLGGVQRFDYDFGAIDRGSNSVWQIEPLGASDNVLADYRVEQIGATGRISGDFSAINPTGPIMAQVFDGNELVHSEMVSGPTVAVDGNSDLAAKPRRFYIGFDRTDNGDGTSTNRLSICWRTRAATTMQLPSGTTVSGDALLYVVPTAQEPGRRLIISSIATTLSDTSFVTMTDAIVGQFGNGHRANGVVMEGVANPVNPDGPALGIRASDGGRISGGVSLEKADPLAPSFDVYVTPVAINSPDETLEVRTFGSIAGVLSSAISVATLRGNAQGGVDLSAEHGDLTDMTEVRVLDNGVVVGQAVVPAGQIGTMMPVGEEPLAADLFRDIRICIGIRFRPLRFNISIGSAFAPVELTGDEIQLIAHEPTMTVENLETMELGVTNLDAFTIVDEVVGDIVPDCPGDIDGSGDVGFSDLTALLNAWGPCGVTCDADLDGSGDVGFADLTALLNAWGPCA